ncbi:MAG: alginate export family protein [Candidatus Loosdrechtia sp.]|uniref:alginate export family protein n=1 Tax=Candidatus Loosdrechtia sp. TaxID=3101272 RepID=UPI00403AF170
MVNIIRYKYSVILLLVFFFNTRYPRYGTFAQNIEQLTKITVNEAAPETRNYFVERRSYGTRTETEPPRYVRTLNLTGIDIFRDIYWLDVGLDYRLRYEYRNNDFRRNINTVDEPVLLRTRAFLALREIWDPFRFTIELEDARRYNSQFNRDIRDVNEFEPIQAFVELYFKEGLGAERPLSIKAGRMAFEFMDRRLIARNEWRNTTNTFQGFRATFGQQINDWQLNMLAVQPLERLKYDLDRPIEEQWFYGTIGNWRRWSHIVTLQPYYLGLRQDGGRSNIDRDIHTAGLRGYGIVGNTGFDYDLQVIYQFGRHGTEQHSAFASTSEVGYTFDHLWLPRLALFYGYASGDRDPTDNKNQRFERLFGFARPWSSNDYFQMENISNPKLIFEFSPAKKLRIDTAYAIYWLASDTDRWNAANLRDRSGKSGNFIGQEYNIRIRYKLTSCIDTSTGYAYFKPGEFTRNTGRSENSHFFYIEVSINAFK